MENAKKWCFFTNYGVEHPSGAFAEGLLSDRNDWLKPRDSSDFDRPRLVILQEDLYRLVWGGIIKYRGLVAGIRISGVLTSDRNDWLKPRDSSDFDCPRLVNVQEDLYRLVWGGIIKYPGLVARIRISVVLTSDCNDWLKPRDLSDFDRPRLVYL